MTSRESCYANILAGVGHTPLLQLTQFDTGPCQLFVKLECCNPGGSIKDRIACFMIEAAEREGRIKPGDCIIEATAGNTGLGLALVAAQKGYHLIIVMPDRMSEEKTNQMRAMGVEMVLTRSGVEYGHPEHHYTVACRIAQERGAYHIDQFSNPANVVAHEQTTGPEIWDQMEGRIDAFVCGVGSGGTLTGVGRYLRTHNPNVALILGDPVGSMIADHIKGREIAVKPWLVEGVGSGFLPAICDLSLVDEVYTITDKEAFYWARQLLQRESVMAGTSSGTMLAAALRYCQAQTTSKRVVTLVADTGMRYLSRLYNHVWMQEQGLL